MEEGRDTGNNDYERSCPYGSDNTSEAGNIGADGNDKGKNGDSRFSTAKKFTNKTILGKSFLEPRLLRYDGWDR